MKIALFGGSFNPIHTDHILIMEHLYKKEKFDEVWIIPTKNHAFKKKIKTTDKDRVNMINIAIKKFDFIKLKLIELKNKNRISYTYDTVKKIIKKNPNNDFRWIIGTDLIEKISKWKNIDKLSKICKLLAFPRIGFNIKNKDIYDRNIIQFNIDIISSCKVLHNINSTDIRKGNNLNIQLPEIIEYINKSGLYLKDRLLHNLSHNEKRYKHCVNVANMAVKLAKKNGFKREYSKLKDIYIAGKLHDITKKWELEKHKIYINKYCKEYINEPIPTLHSYSAYCYTKYILKYNDNITNAIKKHTTCDAEMNLMDKIIFISDKISKERNYKEAKELRKLAFSNLNDAFLKILSYQYNRAIEKNGLNNIGCQLINSVNKWIPKEN